MYFNIFPRFLSLFQQNYIPLHPLFQASSKSVMVNGGKMFHQTSFRVTQL